MIKIHYRSIEIIRTLFYIHLRHHFSVTRILYYVDAGKEAISSFTSIDGNTITSIVRVVGPSLREKESSTGFTKHRQNDISVSLFRDFNESNQRAVREREGREFFTSRFNSPGCVLRARATLESGLTLEDPPRSTGVRRVRARVPSRVDQDYYTRVQRKTREILSFPRFFSLLDWRNW